MVIGRLCRQVRQRRVGSSWREYHKPELGCGIGNLEDEQLPQAIDVLFFDPPAFLRHLQLPSRRLRPGLGGGVGSYLEPIGNFLINFGDALDPV